MVVANPAGHGQSASYQTRMANKKLESEATLLLPADRPQSRRFVAPAESVELLIEAKAAEEVRKIASVVSIKCEDCEGDEWIKKFIGQADALINTSGGVAANSLITNTLIGGNCFDVTNITSSGPNLSRGTFSNGTASIGINTGVVLCTGNVNVVTGPNNANNASGNTAGQGFNTNSPNDADLATLTAGDQYDVSKIEFDFKPTSATVQFDFVFGSDEYCEYVNSNFNDVFGFFISGPGITGTQNIALIPSTTTPVTINSVNHLSNTAYYVNNNTFTNGGGQPTCQSMTAIIPPIVN